MRARILVLAVNDVDEYVAADAIRAHHSWDEEAHQPMAEWQEEAIAQAANDWGVTLDAHGFIDVEIPDAVIAKVLRRHADAGVVAAEAVAEVES